MPQDAMMDSLATGKQDLPALLQNPIVMDIINALSSGINTGRDAVQGAAKYPLQALQSSGVGETAGAKAANAMKLLTQQSSQDERNAALEEIMQKILEGQVDPKVLQDKLQMAQVDTNAAGY